MCFEQQVPQLGHELRRLVLHEPREINLHLLWANDDSLIAAGRVILELILSIRVNKLVVNAHEFDYSFFDPLLDDVDLNLKEKWLA